MSEEKHDLVIRGGTVVDGTGRPPSVAEVAVDDGRITAIGTVDRPGTEEIDATGLLVAPGWVDVHTHYDGQVSWDDTLTPSSWHGSTTVVMGNCGVGFAPVRPERHGWLIDLMEGVEDIPGTALHEGITWNWETFPEYLDAIERIPARSTSPRRSPTGRSAAAMVGLLDRGVLAPGYRADINLIDHAALQLGQPEMVADLPAGGKRLIQRPQGYRATIVAGVTVMRDGVDTGARPGQLVRGAKPRPA